MTLSPMQVGLAIGGSVGLIGFVLLRRFAAWTEQKKPGEQGQMEAAVLRKLAVADLVLMLLLGAFIGQTWGS